MERRNNSDMEEHSILKNASGVEITSFIFRILSFCVGFYLFVDYLIDCSIKTNEGFIAGFIGITLACFFLYKNKR